MTTIAFDGRYLAADGRMTRSDIVCSSTVKKLHLVTTALRGVEQEVIVFGAGSWQGIYTVMEWMKVNDVFDTSPDLPRPSFSDEHTQDVAFAKKGGEIYCLDNLSRPAPMPAPYAEGSGFPYAQMGLELGMSAPDAVKAAMKMDVFSGGDITCFDTVDWVWVNPETLEPLQAL